MVIDLRKCIGCWSCTIACKQAHFLPPDILWTRIIMGESGSYPVVYKEMYPILCNHCDDAACVEVCPTGASHKRDDGIVLIDYDKCMGCASCVLACPYQQRSMLSADKAEYFPGQGLTPFERMGSLLYPLQKGTAVKCTLCAERIDQGLEQGLRPGKDREATPACVNACPTRARIFGDIHDPESEVSSLIKEMRGGVFHPEFGTSPSVFYVGK
jgi:Fe-S-cluster-containing dehydrogenase component